jgi:hypothetical protein
LLDRHLEVQQRELLQQVDWTGSVSGVSGGRTIFLEARNRFAPANWSWLLPLHSSSEGGATERFRVQILAPRSKDKSIGLKSRSGPKTWRTIRLEVSSSERPMLIPIWNNSYCETRSYFLVLPRQCQH